MSGSIIPGTHPLSPLSNDPRWEEARSLQRLYTRLFFCDETLKDFRRDRKAVLSEFGIAESLLGGLPDVASQSFAAESNGRRLIVAKDLLTRFPNTAAHLVRAPRASVDDFLKNSDFRRFIGSDHFLLPNHALPHAFGIGPGYECTSKFFFWCRDEMDITPGTNDPRLRLLLLAEFAAFLLESALDAAPSESQDDASFFNRLGEGLFFSAGRRDPRARYWVAIDDPGNGGRRTCQVFRTEESCEKLLSAGMNDLEELLNGLEMPPCKTRFSHAI